MIKPIQTRYAGYLFRSRLEARWAVFFDAMKFDWKYEHEGFVLASGAHYLPDFMIKLANGATLVVEVKPQGSDSSKLSELMDAAPFNWRAVVLSDIPDPRERYYGHEVMFGNNSDPDDMGHGWDDSYRFCVCPTCRTPGFEFGAAVERIKCACGDGISDEKSIIGAFAKARSARFEHEDREIYTGV